MSQPSVWNRIGEALQSRRAYRIFGSFLAAFGIANLVKFFTGHSREVGLDPFNGILNTIVGLLFVFGKHPRPPTGPISLNLNAPESKSSEDEKIGA